MEDLTREQTLFLEAEGKVIVRACPGSGKTYSVANKLLSYVDNWNSYHQGVAVLSFTNVASEEIYKKAFSLNKGIGKLDYPHYIGTVDSFINEFIVLRYGYLKTHDKVRPLIALSDNWKLPYKYWRTECYRKGCVDNIEKFQWGIDNKFYKDKEVVNCELRGKSQLLPCQQYKVMLMKKNVIFQNEVASFAYRLLKEYPMIATAIVERFPVIIIDEAQDTSEEQMAVFDLLTKAGVKSIFLVGDPDQAIYEWRNASPECFKKKIGAESWECIELTGNFRSSQHICNATSYFSATLQGQRANEAVGEYKDETQKPILLLTNGNTENEVINCFLEKCRSMEIEIKPDKVAMLTRGRIHSDTDIKELWKSKEIELIAKAAYEWKCGSRKKACSDMSKASFRILIGEEIDDYLMRKKIMGYTDEDNWKDFIIDIFRGLPDINLGIAEWINQFTNLYSDILKRYNFHVAEGINIKDILKIKTRDKSNPEFRHIPLKNYFEKKTSGNYTRSSIHGVKGETYDAVLIYIKSKTGKTLTPKFLMEGDLEDELMRIAYVAMTRPRRLLMIAMPENKKLNEYQRFPVDKWDYEYI